MTGLKHGIRASVRVASALAPPGFLPPTVHRPPRLRRWRSCCRRSRPISAGISRLRGGQTVAAKYHLNSPASGLGYGDVRSELRELADDGASLIIAHASGYNTAPEDRRGKHVPVAIVDVPRTASRRRRGLHLSDARARICGRACR